MYYMQELKRINQALCERKDDLEQELSSLPKGHLYSYVGKDNRTYYYERTTTRDGRMKRVGINKNPERLAALVRKNYVQKAISIARKNSSVLESAIGLITPFDEASLMSDFVRSHPSKEPFIYKNFTSAPCDNQSICNPQDDSNSLLNEGLKSISHDGVPMRSMGEIAIAARLDHFGIQYKYEAELQVPELRYVPDFTIRRAHDGRIIYWEHLGKISDKEYMQHNRRKFDDYEEYGIVPWRNLIVTYGTEDGGINMKIVDAMIQGWLL